MKAIQKLSIAAVLGFSALGFNVSTQTKNIAGIKVETIAFSFGQTSKAGCLAGSAGMCTTRLDGPGYCAKVGVSIPQYNNCSNPM